MDCYKTRCIQSSYYRCDDGMAEASALKTMITKVRNDFDEWFSKQKNKKN